MAAIQPVLRYPGGKYRLAPWIVEQMPAHGVYVEPFFGGGSIFFAKAPARVEVLNDLDGRVVNLFRVLRERPEALARAVALTPYSRAEYEASDDATDDELEAARRFLVRVWMAHAGKLGSKSGWRQGWAGGTGALVGSSARVWCGVPARIAAVAARLREAMIDCRPALEVLADWQIAEAVVYADPPYPMRTRVGGDDPNGRWAAYYAHEMTDADHVALIAALNAHPGPVLLSGYRCQLYDDLLVGWERRNKDVRAYRNALRTESLWLNRACVERRRDLFSVAGVTVA
jgi:DNA adenine methylase